MNVDEPGAIAIPVPEEITFNSNDAMFLVVHKTAGFSTAQQCAEYFGNLNENTGHASSHYIIGMDGTIVQCVPEVRGAGANCCVEAGHADFIPDTWNGQDDNGNMHSISIEHIDPSLDNSTMMPAAQIQASFQLIKHVCERHNIPKRAAQNDNQGGIIGHNQIDPESRARCPGPTYPFSELYAYLSSEENQPVSIKPYSSSSRDFGNYFTEDANTKDWTCKQTGHTILSGNRAAYVRMSVDGDTLPVIGLPTSGEQPQKDADGYTWTKQAYERGEIWSDPGHRHDNQPGFGNSYLGKIDHPINADVKPAIDAAIASLQKIG